MKPPISRRGECLPAHVAADNRLEREHQSRRADVILARNEREKEAAHPLPIRDQIEGEHDGRHRIGDQLEGGLRVRERRAAERREELVRLDRADVIGAARERRIAGSVIRCPLLELRRIVHQLPPLAHHRRDDEEAEADHGEEQEQEHRQQGDTTFRAVLLQPIDERAERPGEDERDGENKEYLPDLRQYPERDDDAHADANKRQPRTRRDDDPHRAGARHTFLRRDGHSAPQWAAQSTPIPALSGSCGKQERYTGVRNSPLDHASPMPTPDGTVTKCEDERVPYP